MTQISSLGAGMFSQMSVAMPAVELTPVTAAALDTAAEFAALFATLIAAGGVKAAGTFMNIPNVREYPAIGVPANISNVPRYGSRISAQVQGQSDAPSLEIGLNYVGTDWAKEVGNHLALAVGDGKLRCFRFAMMNAEPAGFASTSAGVGTVENSLFYFLGKLEAIVYTPNLTEANQATLTLSMQSDLYGSFTVDPV